MITHISLYQLFQLQLVEVYDGLVRPNRTAVSTLKSIAAIIIIIIIIIVN